MHRDRRGGLGGEKQAGGDEGEAHGFRPAMWEDGAVIGMALAGKSTRFHRERRTALGSSYPASAGGMRRSRCFRRAPGLACDTGASQNQWRCDHVSWHLSRASQTSPRAWLWAKRQTGYPGRRSHRANGTGLALSHGAGADPGWCGASIVADASPPRGLRDGTGLPIIGQVDGQGDLVRRPPRPWRWSLSGGGG